MCMTACLREIFVSRLQYNNSISCIPIYFLHESTPSVSDICLVYQYITIHIRDIKNMKIVFQFNIAIAGGLNQNFRIQFPKQLLCHFCNGLFKIHFYKDVVGCLLGRSLHIPIYKFSVLSIIIVYL